jgi:hypothetical protein
MTGYLPALPADLAHDWRGLSQLIAATAERQPVPCRVADIAPIAGWTSEDPREQAIAATACQACPVLEQCRAYGLNHPKESGVYGGITEHERVRLARARQTNPAAKSAQRKETLS